ncbi:MAG: hypothetical protein M1822_005408 [Bathelium mastoideum]|nr:MAG: hypothetical protein M1822_005408 [Bathelium mastoideum]
MYEVVRQGSKASSKEPAPTSGERPVNCLSDSYSTSFISNGTYVIENALLRMTGKCEWVPQVPQTSSPASEDSTWLNGLSELSTGYPAIKGLLERTKNSEARQIVREKIKERHDRAPGRCVLLNFHETHVEDQHFNSPADLANYLDQHPPQTHLGLHRLWILEDLELEWVEVLGGRLGVDPLVFSEQTNTFNFTGADALYYTLRQPSDD